MIVLGFCDFQKYLTLYSRQLPRLTGHPAGGNTDLPPALLSLLTYWARATSRRPVGLIHSQIGSSRYSIGVVSILTKVPFLWQKKPISICFFFPFDSHLDDFLVILEFWHTVNCCFVLSRPESFQTLKQCYKGRSNHWEIPIFALIMPSRIELKKVFKNVVLFFR